MTLSEKVKEAIISFDAITWCSCGDPNPYKDDPSIIHPGWIKFGIEKTELGWRTLEFFSWITTSMIQAGESIDFFPTAPPPYLNEPGECLSFVLEIHPKEIDQQSNFTKIATYIADCHENYWEECKP